MDAKGMRATQVILTVLLLGMGVVVFELRVRNQLPNPTFIGVLLIMLAVSIIVVVLHFRLYAKPPE